MHVLSCQEFRCLKLTSLPSFVSMLCLIVLLMWKPVSGSLYCVDAFSVYPKTIMDLSHNKASVKSKQGPRLGGVWVKWIVGGTPHASLIRIVSQFSRDL